MIKAILGFFSSVFGYVADLLRHLWYVVVRETAAFVCSLAKSIATELRTELARL